MNACTPLQLESKLCDGDEAYVIKWLREGCGEHRFEPSAECLPLSRGVLCTAVRWGHVGIVKLLLHFICR